MSYSEAPAPFTTSIRPSSQDRYKLAAFLIPEPASSKAFGLGLISVFGQRMLGSLGTVVMVFWGCCLGLLSLIVDLIHCRAFALNCLLLFGVDGYRPYRKAPSWYWDGFRLGPNRLTLIATFSFC